MPIRTFRQGLAAVCLAAFAASGSAAPFTPPSDDAVVETLRDRPLGALERQWRSARAAARQRPQDVASAVQAARLAVALSRVEGDPRWVGQAQGALSPWWDLRDPPADVRLLRAVILQNQHQFTAALGDLSQVLTARPDDVQAWLVQASVQQVVGRHAEAAASCGALARLGLPDHARACQMDVGSLQRGARGAYDAESAWVRQAPAALQPWLLIVRAEWADRLGLQAEAEFAYRRLLAASPDAYGEAAYADFLLDHGRAAEVIERLLPLQRNDGLLMRLALAYARVGDSRLGAAVQALGDRFAAARARGDATHRREEARFTLHLLKQPEQALALAEANWADQKEPADARVLLEAARAAGTPAAMAAARAARAFITEAQWVDRRLEALL